MLRKRSRTLLLVLPVLLLPSLIPAQQPKETRITANEFSFKPPKIQIPQGEVKIVVTNRGKFPHSLAIVGREEKIGYIDSGETKSLIIGFDKDKEVIFYCSQPGHRGKGMEGKLSVGKR
jgi:plastocyanin